jgi:hypothetical protein
VKEAHAGQPVNILEIRIQVFQDEVFTREQFPMHGCQQWGYSLQAKPAEPGTY